MACIKNCNTPKLSPIPMTDDTERSSSPSAGASKEPAKQLSCVSCQLRKVKCDRQTPCAACVKSQIECVSQKPSRPRRRSRKEPEAVKNARLRKYEELLRSFGVNLKDVDSGIRAPKDEVDLLEQSTVPKSQPDGQAAGQSLTATSEEHQQGAMISSDGVSKFLDNNLWAGLSDEFRHPKNLSPIPQQNGNFDSPISENPFSDGGHLLFGLTSPDLSLTELHPQPVHIFRLWQAFLDNVNPLSKVIHAPTVQYQILEATGDLSMVSKNVESLMFAIYAAAVNSWDNSECEIILGEPKSTLLSKYFMATQQALIRAGFLKSSDLIILQALTLFLLAIRQHYNPHALWILTGVAVRIGQRMGMHHDGASLGLSVFEIKMRRRVFWQIILLDSRSAQLSGRGLSTMAHLWDTKLPLNVNDSDLTPEMRETPVEHPGITEMVFCLIRYEFGLFLRGGLTIAGFDGNWQLLSSDRTPIAEKDKMLDQLESYLEEKFARYCDPLRPVHFLSSTLIRAAICKMRLVAHHPQQYPDKGASLPQGEKDMLFATSLRMIEYDTMGQSMPRLKRFLWHVNVYFQFDAFVYMLSELRDRVLGDLVERAWKQVQQVYDNHPELLNNISNELYVAIGNLTVKAWTAREAVLALQNSSPPSVIPGFISTLRWQGRGANEIISQSPSKPRAELASSNDYVPMGGQRNNRPVVRDDPMGLFTSDPNLNFEPMALDTGPVDWDYWNGLLQDNESQNVDGSGQKLFG